MTAMSRVRKKRPGSNRRVERSEQVQSLVRALRILNGLSSAENGASLTEISQQGGLPPSTTHRLLTTLEQERFVQFDYERRLWFVGVQAFIAGNGFLKTRNLVGSARLSMRALMEASGETVNLAIEDQDEAVYIAQVECHHMMRAFARPGGRVAMHCSGVGKALLSVLPNRRLTTILQHRGMPKTTAKTLETTSALQDDLARSRERGYAYDNEEHAVGLRCVAAVIFNEMAEGIAALSISGPVARVSDVRVAALGDIVRQYADAITRAVGGELPDWRQRLRDLDR